MRPLKEPVLAPPSTRSANSARHPRLHSYTAPRHLRRQIGQKFSKPQTDDMYYSRTRSMLQKLGLQNYEKNFKKGHLTDQTLPLLTDSALRDVKISPGPRLLILDEIKRDPGFLFELHKLLSEAMPISVLMTGFRGTAISS